MVTAVRELSARELAPLVQAIDAEGLYPEAVMRAFGRAGAFAAHLPRADGGDVDLVTAIRAMAAAGEHCLSTSFCMWCQDALGWYIFASGNDELKEQLGHRVAAGAALGGTALSNPMKTFFGIEQIRLKATRVAGGYRVRGLLPFVSNLGEDHYFGAVFEVEEPKRYVMAVVPCAHDGVTLHGNTKFVALDGTRTFGVQIRDAFIPDALVLADPSDAYIKRIRAGFVLLQTGMAFGLIRGCIGLMNQTKGPLGHVNKYLDVQPEAIAEGLAKLEAQVELLAATPFELHTELLACGDRDPAGRRRSRGRGRACRDAALWRARLCRRRRRAAPAAGILLRRHRHAGDQAAQEDACRHVALTTAAGRAVRSQEAVWE